TGVNYGQLGNNLP
nr:RecName: Full=27 kDa cell wall protein [Solanum lycopersicum]